MALIGFGWACLFLFFPLFNRDRLRVGDLLAGTWVIRAPKRKLGLDLVRDAEARPPDLFTPEQLDAYGVFELQTLENVLRSGSSDAKDAVAATIRNKIGSPPFETNEEFLRAYYEALGISNERDGDLAARWRGLGDPRAACLSLLLRSPAPRCGCAAARPGRSSSPRRQLGDARRCRPVERSLLRPTIVETLMAADRGPCCAASRLHGRWRTCSAQQLGDASMRDAVSPRCDDPRTRDRLAPPFRAITAPTIWRVPPANARASLDPAIRELAALRDQDPLRRRERREPRRQRYSLDLGVEAEQTRIDQALRLHLERKLLNKAWKGALVRSASVRNISGSSMHRRRCSLNKSSALITRRSDCTSNASSSSVGAGATSTTAARS